MTEHFKARCPQLLRPLTLQNGIEEMAAYMTKFYLAAVRSEVVHVQKMHGLSPSAHQHLTLK